MILGISGKVGSGKTTCMNLLEDKLLRKAIVVEKRNFADKLKKICFELTGHFGYTQEQKNVFLDEWGMTVGEVLQKVGTDALRDNFHQNVWVISTLKDIKVKTKKVYLIGDVRFPNEVEAIKKKGGKIIRLEGDPAGVRKNSKRDLTHHSETALDDYTEWDIIYQNVEGLEELEIFAEKIIQDFCSSKDITLNSTSKW